MNRVEGVGGIRGSDGSPDKGTTDPLQQLVWLAAEVCGITPLDALTLQSKPAPLARHMVTAWLHDFEGWKWHQIAGVLGRSESTLRKNHGNYRRKLRGPNGLIELYAVFMRRAARLDRMNGVAPGRAGSFLHGGIPPRGLTGGGVDG